MKCCNVFLFISIFFFTFYLQNLYGYLLHLVSSDPSLQSKTPLHTRFLGMQSPFEQVASWRPQAEGGRGGGGVTTEII